MVAEARAGTSTGPLTGVRIIEIGAIGPAPFTAMMLADMGAEVIRIDRKEVRQLDGSSNDYITRTSFTSGAVINRGRRSIAMNLKIPSAVETVLCLVERADILIEGFRPGVMERLGLGPAVCLERNPALVFGRITGWGQTGPLAKAAGHELNYIAVTGALHMTRSSGSQAEPKSPPGFGDFGGGGMFLAFGVMCALLEARANGSGQVVDAAICDGASMLLAPNYSMIGAGLWDPEPASNPLDGGSHFFQSYECADGHWVTIGAIEPQFYRELVERLGISDDPDFQRQMDPAAWPVLKAKLAAIFKSRSRDEWCGLLEGTDACFAPVLDPVEATRHPHLIARDRYIELAGVVQPAPAPIFSRTKPSQPSPPPVPGEHTEAALKDWGISQDRLQVLRTEGAI
jgi:alpha-methylacyl-CoA racemase